MSYAILFVTQTCAIENGYDMIINISIFSFFNIITSVFVYPGVCEEQHLPSRRLLCQSRRG